MTLNYPCGRRMAKNGSSAHLNTAEFVRGSSGTQDFAGIAEERASSHCHLSDGRRSKRVM